MKVKLRFSAPSAGIAESRPNRVRDPFVMTLKCWCPVLPGNEPTPADCSGFKVRGLHQCATTPSPHTDFRRFFQSLGYHLSPAPPASYPYAPKVFVTGTGKFLYSCASRFADHVAAQQRMLRCPTRENTFMRTLFENLLFKKCFLLLVLF